MYMYIVCMLLSLGHLVRMVVRIYSTLPKWSACWKNFHWAISSSHLDSLCLLLLAACLVWAFHHSHHHLVVYQLWYIADSAWSKGTNLCCSKRPNVWYDQVFGSANFLQFDWWQNYSHHHLVLYQLRYIPHSIRWKGINLSCSNRPNVWYSFSLVDPKGPLFVTFLESTNNGSFLGHFWVH